ncbi:MAG: hypothetical protein WC836_23200 [Desulfobacula sp.]
MMKKVFWTGWMVFLLISTAFADGDSRHATSGEKTWTLKVLKAFESALPQGPGGWSKVEKTDLKPPEIVVQGQETFPMRVDYHIKWQDDKRIHAAKAETDRQLMKSAQKQSSDTKMKDYMADMEKLSKEFGKAMEAKDNVRAEALQKEMEALGKRFNEQASGNNQAFEQQIREITPHDVELKIDLSANVFYQEFVRIPSEQTVLEGCPVIRMDNEDHTSRGWHEGTTYVFLGDFRYVRKDNTVSMQADKMPGAPSTKVRTVVIRVSGEKGRANRFIEQMNLLAIKALFTD